MTVAATHNRRILVIDDNESIHEDFCRILQSSGTVSSEIDKVEAELFGNTEAPGPPRDSFELDFALQGQNGYERVLQAVNAGRPYALAFVDVRMPPGWDGIETIERLWDIDPDLQIAVCTAYADYSWDEIIARLGRTDKLLLLKKPFDKAEVWQLACSLTEKWRLARQADQKLGELGKAIENRTAELEVEVFERRRIEEALRESEERYRNVYETAPLAFVLWDRECRLIGWNDRAEEIFGWSKAEVLGRDIFQFLVHEHAQPQLRRLNESLLRGDKARDIVSENLTKDGQTIICLWNNSVLRDKEGVPTAVMSLALDITDQQRAQAELRRVAYHDPLTALPNRTLLMDRLTHRIERARRNPDSLFAVLFLDLDNFKLVNDSLGHKLGDELLIEVAARLNASLRSLDTIVRLEEDATARIGGDEFVLLLDEIWDESSAVLVAERLLDHLTPPFELSGHELAISASIGITIAGGEYTDAHDILRDADTAMYRAKNAGRRRYVVFNREMHVAATRRLQLENDLRHALERGELRVVYQPIVDATVNKVAGLEALLRWERPDGEDIGPDEFIPVAEDSGLIIPIGSWMIEHACRQLQEWNSTGYAKPSHYVNVNLSRRQLLDNALCGSIQRTLSSTGLPPEQLNLEITEGAIIGDFEAARKRLSAIKSMGVGLHMDDFGTGYSSLNCLHRFPFDVVKIDRSFITTMGTSRAYAAVIWAIITLAHNLNMKVTVEGIETADHLAQVLSLECDFVQGYVFSKPVDADTASQLLGHQFTLPEAAVSG